MYNFYVMFRLVGNKYKKCSPCNSGFTMVEVIVALGIVTVVSLGVAQLMKSINDKQLLIKKKADIQLLQQNLLPILRDSVNCVCNFQGIRINPKKLPERIDINHLTHSCGKGSPWFVSTGSSVSGSTAVDSIYLANIKSSGNENEFLADVGIKPKLPKNMMVMKDAIAQIRLYTGLKPEDDGTMSVIGCGDVPPNCYLPWVGATIAHRESVVAYKSKEAPNCQEASEIRVCEFGSLKGSFPFARCRSTDCITPWGKRVKLGAKVIAYRSNYAPNCEAVKNERICLGNSTDETNNQVLLHPNADVTEDIERVSSGVAVTVTKHIIAGQSILTGGGIYESCQDKQCSGPEGKSYYEGDSEVFYREPISENCEVFRENRVCHAGNLTGSYEYKECVNNHCTLPWGERLNNGDTYSGYLSSSAEFCEEEKFSTACVNGYLSRSNISKTCVSIGCITPWGEKVRFNSSVKAYRDSKSVNCEASDFVERRTCSKPQVLSGSFQSKTCENIVCRTPWGATVEEGKTITAYREKSAGNCVSETRTCNNGNLSGSYEHNLCRELTCNFNGQILREGQSATAYVSPAAKFCASESRFCRDGQMTGSYLFPSCSIIP